MHQASSRFKPPLATEAYTITTATDYMDECMAAPDHTIIRLLYIEFVYHH